MDRIMAAMYLRLSNEDRDKEKGEESNSISAQRALLTRHIEELLRGQEYGITEFCDDGYSGVDFRRPGVQALIEAAKGRDIHMIVVKDFSRFGRDYLEVGRFLEYIFPILQVRFVSVNDAQTKAEAQQAISEDGYWGVKQTSQRIFDFAYALAGDDTEKMKEMQAAVEKGFEQATKSWGRSLPSIAQETHSAIGDLFDSYYEKAGKAE